MQHVGTWFNADLGSAGLMVRLGSRVFSGDENAIHDLEANCNQYLTSWQSQIVSIIFSS